MAQKCDTEVYYFLNLLVNWKHTCTIYACSVLTHSHTYSQLGTECRCMSSLWQLSCNVRLIMDKYGRSATFRRRQLVGGDS